MQVGGLGEGNDAGAADEVFDVGLLDPAVGFVLLEFELGDGLDGVARYEDLGVGGIELERGVFGPGQCAIGFFGETGRDSLDGVGQ